MCYSYTCTVLISPGNARKRTICLLSEVPLYYTLSYYNERRCAFLALCRGNSRRESETTSRRESDERISSVIDWLQYNVARRKVVVRTIAPPPELLFPANVRCASVIMYIIMCVLLSNTTLEGEEKDAAGIGGWQVLRAGVGFYYYTRHYNIIL